MRHLTLISLFRQAGLLLAFAALAACGEGESPETLLKRADIALAEGRDNAALIDVRAAQQQAPNSREARRLLSEIEMWRQNPTAAIEEAERALQGGAPTPAILITLAKSLIKGRRYSDFDALVADGTFTSIKDDPRYLSLLARAQASWGDSAKARATINQALEKAPSDPDVASAYALLTIENNMTLKEAMGRLEESVTKHPLAYEVWSALGILQITLKNYDAGADAFMESLKINPYRLTDRYLLADALIRSQRYDEALEVIDVMEKLVDSPSSVHYLRAQWHIAQEHLEEAIESANSVLGLEPKNEQALLIAALANTALGNLGTARQQWLILATLDAYQPQTNLRLAKVLARLGETAESEALLREILNEYPENLGAKQLLATALIAQGRNAESTKLYEELLSINPKSTANIVQYSSVLNKSGKRDQAIEQLKTARKLAPGSAEVRARLVSFLLSDGREAEAEQEVASYLDDYSDKAVAHVLAGRFAYVIDEPNAEAHYEHAIEIEPGNKPANSALAEMRLKDGNYREALALYRTILASHENDLDTLIRIAAVQSAMGDPKSMESTLLQAYEAHPASARPPLSLARYYVANKRYNDTVRLISSFEGNGAADPRLYALLAQSHMAMGETSSAVAAAKRMQKVEPTNALGFILEARALVGGEKLAAATDALREALKINNSPAIRSELITALLLDGKSDLARTVLRTAPENAFTAAERALTEGQIKAGVNNLQGAAVDFIQAYELDPSEKYATLTAKTYWRAGDQDSAISVLQDWLTRDSSSVAALGQISGYLLEQGKNADALPYLETLNDITPKQASVLNNLAWASMTENPKQCLRFAQQAVELAPGNIDIQDTLALAYAVNGRAEEALALSDELIRQAPSNSALVVSRARILGKLDETQQAIQLLNSLIARNKDVNGAQELLDAFIKK
ncbi:XrtA/PEP-CTERM system TPR-repeat protein PrsT [Congregibacter litoralis]|uniref:Putative PEP-CTERM system TPR-repeat protein lipoprotein n=1 Tax=Congregibacter litoralis KT71 TaxID=314285 RepID=A4A572_9GAMM|nr:XrtA/PEP-CTERM system TPR-repeat protein PrsT [Congregibacter litoralis]EAQ98943.1 putative PEP-CTERM system TPR-repeat protein lipoprotein [Congregibacter litoralis KT71]